MTNTQRIARAQKALVGGGYDETDSCSITDLIADLMHLAAKQWPDLDFEEHLRIARMHFLAESIDARKRRKHVYARRNL